LKDWDAIPTERGILTLTLTERERDLILTGLDSLMKSSDGEAEELCRRCRALTARLYSVALTEEREAENRADG
ncbi:MAG: hypothetical protein IJT94_15780, partial [Oscillibacter sp.]|nr:hypothetical protein [Oscillibacter sp.]